ncbi:MAG TPA: FtsX-like permease family protein, partial [Mucilaginibacter sp.]
QILIIGTLIVATQMDYFENRDLGFNKDAVITFYMPDMAKNDAIKDQLLKNPGVKQISFSSAAPAYNTNFMPFSDPANGIIKDDVTEGKSIDENYTDMFGLTMLAGQKIVKTNSTDSIQHVVVNETLIHKLGIQNPQQAIGHEFMCGLGKSMIVGVVKDFQSESKHKKRRPCILFYSPRNFFMVSVKLQPANMHQTVDKIDKIWSAMFPDDLFQYQFLDEHIAEQYRQEEKEYAAFKIFSFIAILIGCLGLYGLVAFAAVQRTKEVGIRKVLGASLANIVYLFSKEFILLIAIAFVIAAPVAYFIMNNWLQNFAYQVNIGAGTFAVAILTSVIIAAATIAHQAIKAGVANPVKALKEE